MNPLLRKKSVMIAWRLM